uniref:Secreted protein n=1 Tax=Anopheles epiroticus TaxID=199890 RepID=A0A182PT34_9DIPT
MAPLTASLTICALALAVLPAAHSRGLPESTGQQEACGQHYDELVKASTTWHDKECNGTSKQAACIVPEHEQSYRDLKQRCQQAYDDRTTKANAMYAKLPSYLIEVGARVNQLKVSLQNDLPNMQEMVSEQKQMLESAWKYGAQLQRELMLTSMESDHMQRALVLHSLLVNASLEEMMKESYEYHGKNGRMVARMLKFVRLLPAAEERVAVYKQLAELLKSNGQDGQFPAVIFSADVKQLEDRYKPDHAQYEGKVLERWQTELLAGSFHEVATFAQDYPEYFAGVEQTLYEALKKKWSVDALDKMISFPSAMPVAAQRVRALRAVLEALLDHQSEQNNDVSLIRLAQETAKVEAAAGKDDAEALQALEEVKKLFGKFTYQRDFQAYEALYKLLKGL